MAERRPDLLESYRAKRTLERTPEPAGAVAASGAGGLFVVHKHAARHLHFDLRLEMEGVLRSWAVPKGPSPNPKDKRLAVHVEDHPIEYGDFEGLIPEGNYGAGAVIVWDRGRWIPIGDPIEGLSKGKLLFQLNGYKLHGMWTLVKLKKGQKEWLLIKERDQYVTTEGTEGLSQVSVLSGMTVEELKAGQNAAAALEKELAKKKLPQRALRPESVELMLAETADRAFSKPGWLFELKLDGYRILAARHDGDVKLVSRNGNDLSAGFPEVVRALRALPIDRFLIDGEVVTLDDAGRPSFQRLQQRARLRRSPDVKRAVVESPATFFAFDLLSLLGFDLRGLPLRDRKAILARVVPPLGATRYLEHFEKEGEALYAQTERLGLEGIVAKRADSPYRAGRSPAWLKIRARKTDDFVVVGFTAPKGTRAGFGALHLAQFVDGELIYSGRAGSGFTGKQLDEIRGDLEKHRRATPACSGPVPPDKSTVWVTPELVCEVEFTEWTDEGLLRQPVFLRFRDDKRPEDCVRQGGSRGKEEAVQAVADDPADPATHEVRFSNLDKVFWPEEKYTKGDLIEYYRAISPWLLPYLRNRPLVLTRYPDGIAGKSFFQKDAPAFIPEWLRTERMWSEDAQREIDYFVCDDEASLLYIVNLGTIPLHLWASRVGSLEKPDWFVLDLDPKEAPFAHVVEIARALRHLCEEIELPSFIKTSGSSGLHVLVPLGGQCSYEQARSLAEVLAQMMVAELPKIATLVRAVSKREGKVYLDYIQNGAGRLLAAPFCVRPLPGAPVSAPLEWSEVTQRLDIGRFTIETMPKRMAKLGRDPLLPLLELKPDLGRALALLAARADGGKGVKKGGNKKRGRGEGESRAGTKKAG